MRAVLSKILTGGSLYYVKDRASSLLIIILIVITTTMIIIFHGKVGANTLAARHLLAKSLPNMEMPSSISLLSAPL